MTRASPIPAYGNVLDLIGDTPLVKLTHLDTGPCELFAKLECNNPAGSIKDRIGLRMIEAAERDGKIRPGGTIVEATAGNTGLGLALAAIHKGYKLLLVIPDKMSQEKIFHLRAMGVEIVMTRSDVSKGHPEYYQDMAKRIAGEMQARGESAFCIDQFSNPANPQTHEDWTAPEIWEQMEHRLDAVVAGVGSGGVADHSLLVAELMLKVERIGPVEWKDGGLMPGLDGARDVHGASLRVSVKSPGALAARGRFRHPATAKAALEGQAEIEVAIALAKFVEVREGDIILRVRPARNPDQNLMQSLWLYFRTALFPNSLDLVPDGYAARKVIQYAAQKVGHLRAVHSTWF